MPKYPRFFITIALVLLICGAASAKARPKYRMRTQSPAVDAQGRLNNHSNQNQTTGRNFGRSVSVGAATSPGTAVGTTYYDYQHHSSTGRQIDEHDGRIQVSWTKASGPSITQRTVNWNSTEIVTSALTTILDNGDAIRLYPLVSVDNLGLAFAAVRPGSTNLRLTPTGSAIVGFHDAPEPGGVVFWAAHVDSSSGLGIFGYQNQSPFPIECGYGCIPSGVWPKFAISTCGETKTIHHAVGSMTYSFATEVWYWRGELSGPMIDWSEMPGHLPIMIDSSEAVLSTIIEAQGDYVTIAMLKWIGNNNYDLIRYESTDCGLTWPGAGNYENLTNYTGSNPEGGYRDVSAAYDDAGEIHIVWDTAPSNKEDPTFPTRLYHWSEATGIRLVTSADWINSCEGGASSARLNNGGGVNNAAISDVEISIKPAGLGPWPGIADELIYAIWTQYGPSDTDCATIDDQGTLGGYHNADIYCSVSSNGGSTWDRPSNLTGTVTPDCEPGDCLSESWVTAAATADSGIYISYVLDLHAGGAVVGEGVWTENPYMVLAVETREPVLEPVIAVSPKLFLELNADPGGGAETVDLNIQSVGNADLTYVVTVMLDDGGASHVLVNGGAIAVGTIIAGGSPDVITVTYDCAGLGDPEEFAWRLEVTSNDKLNDPGQGGSPIEIDLQVFSTSTWYSCVEDTLSTGLNVMQVSSCLEMGDLGVLGVGFWDPATLEEWMYSGSPLITLVTSAGDTVAYHNAHMRMSDRTRAENKSFRAQSDLLVTRDTTMVVGDSTYTADVAQGLWSTTDTTIGGSYEMVFPKDPNLNNGAYFKYTMSSLTGETIDDVSYGVIADIDLDDPTGLGGSVDDNTGIASEDLSYVGGQSGILDTLGVFTSYNTYMAIFPLILETIFCASSAGIAGQVLSNDNYVLDRYSTDSLYMLTQLFGGAGSWGSDIYINTGQEADDISVIIIDGYNRMLEPADTITWGYGVAVSDVSVADLEANIAAIRAIAYPPTSASCIIETAGDVNVSGAITSADIIYLVAYAFRSGPEPLPCAANGDVNCSGDVSSTDIIYMVNQVFKGGDPPCDICCNPGAQVCVP